MRRHRRHISLSLSLSTPWFLGKKPSVGAGFGARHDLLAGPRRALGCGVHRSRACRGPFERRRTRRFRPGRPGDQVPRPGGCAGFSAATEIKSLGREGAGPAWLISCRAGRHDHHPRPRRSASLSLGCSSHNPGEAIKESKALAPSRVWSPGRRGPTDLGPRRPPMTTRSGASLRPRSLVCVAHFAHCVLDLLAPRRPGDLLRPGCSPRRGGGW
jgi:hypothetical protein